MMKHFQLYFLLLKHERRKESMKASEQTYTCNFVNESSIQEPGISSNFIQVNVIHWLPATLPTKRFLTNFSLTIHKKTTGISDPTERKECFAAMPFTKSEKISLRALLNMLKQITFAKWTLCVNKKKESQNRKS